MFDKKLFVCVKTIFLDLSSNQFLRQPDPNLFPVIERNLLLLVQHTLQDRTPKIHLRCAATSTLHNQSPRRRSSKQKQSYLTFLITYVLQRMEFQERPKIICFKRQYFQEDRLLYESSYPLIITHSKMLIAAFVLHNNKETMELVFHDFMIVKNG